MTTVLGESCLGAIKSFPVFSVKEIAFIHTMLPPFSGSLTLRLTSAMCPNKTQKICNQTCPFHLESKIEQSSYTKHISFHAEELFEKLKFLYDKYEAVYFSIWGEGAGIWLPSCFEAWKGFKTTTDLRPVCGMLHTCTNLFYEFLPFFGPKEQPFSCITYIHVTKDSDVKAVKNCLNSYSNMKYNNALEDVILLFHCGNKRKSIFEIVSKFVEIEFQNVYFVGRFDVEAKRYLVRMRQSYIERMWDEKSKEVLRLEDVDT